MSALLVRDVFARLTPPQLRIRDVSASFALVAGPKLNVRDVYAQFVVMTAPRLNVFGVYATFGSAPVRHVYTSGAWESARRHVYTSGAWVAIDPP